MTTTSRALLLLPDGFDHRLTHRYLDSIPNARGIMEEGHRGQVLPFTSRWVNINFMSLVTGAPSGTQYRHEQQADLRAWETLPNCGAEAI